jgi:hypothetical protein
VSEGILDFPVRPARVGQIDVVPRLARGAGRRLQPQVEKDGLV